MINKQAAERQCDINPTLETRVYANVPQTKTETDLTTKPGHPRQKNGKKRQYESIQSVVVYFGILLPLPKISTCTNAAPCLETCDATDHSVRRGMNSVPGKIEFRKKNIDSNC
jgi:hypothetical protein